jgi:hypothetical protein
MTTRAPASRRRAIPPMIWGMRRKVDHDDPRACIAAPRDPADDLGDATEG